MMKKIIGAVLIVAVLWSVVSYLNNAGSQAKDDNDQGNTTDKVEELPRINFRAPSFTLQSLDGKSYSIAKAKGKPLVINFWNSWCGPCEKETPELVKLYNQYKGKFQLYGVNITINDSMKAVRNFVDKFNMNYPVLLDRTGDVNTKYRVRAIPTTYFVNKDGIIVDIAIGYLGPGGLTKKVKALISE